MEQNVMWRGMNAARIAANAVTPVSIVSPFAENCRVWAMIVYVEALVGSMCSCGGVSSVHSLLLTHGRYHVYSEHLCMCI